MKPEEINTKRFSQTGKVTVDNTDRERFNLIAHDNGLKIRECGDTVF